MTDAAVVYYQTIIDNDREKERFFSMMEIEDELAFTPVEYYTEASSKHYTKILVSNLDLLQYFEERSKQKANYLLRIYYIDNILKNLQDE